MVMYFLFDTKEKMSRCECMRVFKKERAYLKVCRVCRTNVSTLADEVRTIGRLLGKCEKAKYAKSETEKAHEWPMLKRKIDIANPLVYLGHALEVKELTVVKELSALVNL